MSAHRFDPDPFSLEGECLFCGRRHTHGLSEYKRGCRCEICKQANTAANRRYRAKRGWTPDTRTTFDRFMEKVTKDEATGCWLWTGASKDGYGHMGVGRRTVRAYRWSYEYHVGPIPDGLHLDHLCRVHACVNPDHLEPVTQAENVRRGPGSKTHCKWGHPFDEANTFVVVGEDGSRRRWCRACGRRRAKDQRDKRAASRAAERAMS